MPQVDESEDIVGLERSEVLRCRARRNDEHDAVGADIVVGRDVDGA